MWTRIEEAPNYEVSDQGQVRRNGKVLKPYYQQDGYEVVSLYSKGKKLPRYVHRLVAQAYCTGEGDTVDHINGNRTDNRAENLRFLPRDEHLRLPQKKPSTHKRISEPQRQEILRLFNSGWSRLKIQKHFGVTAKTVRKVTNG